MPITYDDEPNTLIPSDLTDFQTVELLEMRRDLTEQMVQIEQQLHDYYANDVPEHMQDRAWFRRARAARQWRINERARLNQELTRRQEERTERCLEENKARQKRLLEERKIRTNAFVEASKAFVSKETYLEIWRLAREKFPEAFADQTAD